MSTTVTYLHATLDGVAWPLNDFPPLRVLLISELDTPPVFKRSLAARLVRLSGRFLVWGRECEAWHDAIDEAWQDLWEDRDVPDDSAIVTTWHADESLDEVLGFCKRHAWHPVAILNSP